LIACRLSGEETTMELVPTSTTVKPPAANFTGDVYLNGVFSGDGAAQLVVGLVRFSPGARTNWHSHANGQLLVCTDGVGLVGTRDGKTVVLRSGESVWTPAGEEHWHGGTGENMMCHYAILDASGDADATTWLEPVTGEQYTTAHAAAGIPPGQ
jgi:quercetin dioxygenase-like cupin family protein